MTNELIADGIYRVSGMETSLKNGAWVSDAGTYLVTNQTKLADIPDARPGDIAFTAGYGHIWQLDVDSTTWVELPKTAAGTAATQAAASATAAAGSASAAATSASQAQTVAASIPADYTSLSNSVVDLKSAFVHSPEYCEPLSTFDGKVLPASGNIITYTGYTVGVIKIERGKTYRLVSTDSGAATSFIGVSNTLYDGSTTLNPTRVSASGNQVDYYNNAFDYLYYNEKCYRSGETPYTQYVYQLSSDASVDADLSLVADYTVAVQDDSNKRPVVYKSGTDFNGNGNEVASNTMCITDYIPVQGGGMVSIYSNIANLVNGCVFYDSDKVKIGTVHSYEPFPFGSAVPDNARYMRVAVREANYSDIIIRVNPITLTVSSAAELRTALDGIGSGSIDKHYKIIVKNGTYDIASTFTADEINGAEYSANGWCGLVVGNNVHLYGESRDGVVLSCEIATSYAASKRDAISTLNLKGNCTLENLTVTSTNIRYPIHDDFAVSANTVHRLINCSFIAGANASGAKTNGYGLGTRSGETLIFDNCYIAPYMIYHNNTGFTQSSSVTLNNCEIGEKLNLWDFACEVQCYLHLNNVKCPALQHDYNGTHAQTIMIDGIGEGPDFIICSSDVLYNTGDCVKKMVHWGGSAGQLVTDYYANNTIKYNTVAVGNNGIKISGILLEDVANDKIGVVQKSGYISANKLGETNTTEWAALDLLKFDTTTYRLAKTDNANDAIAMVAAVIDGVAYIRLMLR